MVLKVHHSLYAFKTRMIRACGQAKTLSRLTTTNNHRKSKVKTRNSTSCSSLCIKVRLRFVWGMLTLQSHGRKETITLAALFEELVASK